MESVSGEKDTLFSLDLPRMRVDLAELDLVRRYGFAIMIKDEESRGGGALVD